MRTNSPPFSLMCVTSAPPGRGSISTTRQRAGAGIHHGSKLAGSVHAFHTAARGARMMREMQLRATHHRRRTGPMTTTALPGPPPPVNLLADDLVELRVLRVLGPDDADSRAPETRFLASAPECRFAIHRRSDGERVGRIHLRLTNDPAITHTLGHCGYAVDEAHRRHGHATRALRLVHGLARHYGVSPLWVHIEPHNVASRRTAERAGLSLVDVVATAPEAVALGLGGEMCRYAAELP